MHHFQAKKTNFLDKGQTGEEQAAYKYVCEISCKGLAVRGHLSNIGNDNMGLKIGKVSNFR